MEADRYGVIAYPADGVGGRALEAAVSAGAIAGLIDLDMSELAAELLGHPGGAGPDRLTAAAMAGIPQVIAPGGLERLELRDLDRLGREIAHKASASRGPTTILIPDAGWSVDQAVPAESLRVLCECLRSWLIPTVRLQLVPGSIGDPAFAATAWSALRPALRR